MKNKISGKHIYPNDGTDSRLKYCRNLSAMSNKKSNRKSKKL
jgi:hypothetical protein